MKILLTDGGKEYDNEEVRAILNAAGIDQRKPATYTPQQNGHLHILEQSASCIHTSRNIVNEIVGVHDAVFQGELLNVTHECDSIIATTINMPIDEYVLDA